MLRLLYDWRSSGLHGTHWILNTITGSWSLDRAHWSSQNMVLVSVRQCTSIYCNHNQVSRNACRHWHVYIRRYIYIIQHMIYTVNYSNQYIHIGSGPKQANWRCWFLQLCLDTANKYRIIIDNIGKYIQHMCSISDAACIRPWRRCCVPRYVVLVWMMVFTLVTVIKACCLESINIQKLQAKQKSEPCSAIDISWTPSPLYGRACT